MACIAAKDQQMKTILTTGWNVMRVLRTGIGAWAIWLGITEQDTLTGLLGGFLLFTGIFNTGCCGMGGCTVPQSNRTSLQHDHQDASFEIIQPDQPEQLNQQNPK